MRGAFVQREVRAPLALRVAGAAPIEGTLSEVRIYAPDDGDRRTVLHLEIDLATFQRVEDQGLLGLVAGSIDPGVTEYRLISTAPIEIQLRLEGAPAADVQAGSLDAALERVVSRLAAAGDGALLDAASYRWLTVMQQSSTRTATTVKRGFHAAHA